MAFDPKTRAHDTIAQLSTRGLELIDLWQQVSEVIADVVPFYRSPCWYTLDPASLLMTSHFKEDIAEMPDEWLAASTTKTMSTSSATPPGRNGASRRCTRVPAAIRPEAHAGGRNIKYGADQEMICVLRTTDGEAW